MKFKPGVLEEIYFTKKLYSESQRFLTPNADKYDFSFGMILAQDAIELMLGAISLQLEIQIERNSSLDKCFEKIQTELGKKIPYRKEIEKINKARVDIKHHGILKRFDDYKNEISFLPYFFDSASQLAFGVNLSEVSLADMVENVKIKQLIVAAEKALNNGKYRECVENMAWARNEMIGHKFIAGGALYKSFGLRAEDKEVVFENYSDTKAAVILLQHGVDFEKFAYYSAILPDVYYSYKSKQYELCWYSEYANEKNWDEKILRAALNYFIGVAAKPAGMDAYVDFRFSSDYYEYHIKPKASSLNFYSFTSVKTVADKLFPAKVVYTLQEGEVFKTNLVFPSKEMHGEIIVSGSMFSNGFARLFEADAEITKVERNDDPRN